jgi:thymidylate synthase (FAD)
MGSDLTCVNAARVSFDKESTWENEEWGHDDFEDPNYLSDRDSRLIKYLASHGHFTPFTHPQITLRETVPIFVARQRFKHVVGFSYNEVSRRYVDDEPSFYIPDEWRSRPDGSVKQGSGGRCEKNPIEPADCIFLINGYIVPMLQLTTKAY